MKIALYSLMDVYYYSFYVEGFYKLYGKRNVKFSCEDFPAFPDRTFAAIVSDGGMEKKIIIDAFDTSGIFHEQLEWCDIYGKVNYNEKYILENVEKENQRKIISIGPSFGVQTWNFLETGYLAMKNYRKAKNRIHFKRNFFANYWHQYKRRPLREYSTSFIPENNFVFFISSLWEKEEKTNIFRACFIEACKEIEEINFEGGFAPRSDGKKLGFSFFIDRRISAKEYLKKMRKSLVAFNTPAVQNCHGWKLGEFLALGKAIVSTDLLNGLPSDLLDRQHIHFVSPEKEEIKDALETILKNPDYRKSLEESSRGYFEKNLTPEVVVRKLVKGDR